MINTQHLLKVTGAWINIVYIICFVGVALFPGIRSVFMLYGLHTTTILGENVITLTTFIYGLVLWNVIAFLAVGLFVILFNRMKV